VLLDDLVGQALDSSRAPAARQGSAARPRSVSGYERHRPGEIAETIPGEAGSGVALGPPLVARRAREDGGLPPGRSERTLDDRVGERSAEAPEVQARRVTLGPALVATKPAEARVARAATESAPTGVAAPSASRGAPTRHPAGPAMAMPSFERAAPGAANDLSRAVAVREVTPALAALHRDTPSATSNRAALERRADRPERDLGARHAPTAPAARESEPEVPSSAGSHPDAALTVASAASRAGARSQRAVPRQPVVEWEASSESASSRSSEPRQPAHMPGAAPASEPHRAPPEPARPRSAPPIVRVHVGRVVVRAPPQASAPQAQRAPRASPRLSLSDYLDRRGRHAGARERGR
jgi:hypothetical protein